MPPGSMPFEQRLIERFRQGDREALATLFEMYVDRVYGYARQMLGCREDAEEVAADAFVRAFGRAAEFRGECSFRAWLFTIARNLCRDRLRQPALLVIASLDEETTDAPNAERAAMCLDVQAALAELSEEHREVLLLCDAEQWDAREAAELLGRSPAATKSLLYRARRALRDRLAAKWIED